MMTEPKVLLLDEPCAGMVESEMDEVSQLIHLIREEFDISIILIEHHMSFVMNLAERIKVLNFGETIAEGTPDEVRKNPHVIERIWEEVWPMLKVTDLHVYYGMVKAVKGVSFNVNKGEIVALIGANGAGKTTILRTISGLESITSGSIEFKGTELTNKTSRSARVKMGIAHVPEGRRVFAGLTVKQNLELGAILRKDKSGIERDLEYVYEKFPRIKEREKQLAGTLSGGEQQMLAMGRAILTQGDLMLLDELQWD